MSLMEGLGILGYNHQSPAIRFFLTVGQQWGTSTIRAAYLDRRREMKPNSHYSTDITAILRNFTN